MGTFTKGIVLTQNKEPALSKPLVSFVNPQTETTTIDRPPVTDIDALTVDELIDIARAAQIVDERDGKLLYRKLLRCKNRAVAVIADAVDDEPYVSSQLNPMLQLRQQAVQGLEFCKKIAGTDTAVIMAYKNLTDLETRIPRSIEGYPVVRLMGGYPAEPRAARLKVGPGRKLIVGAGALIHFARAVVDNRPQTTAFVTVAGNCVNSPMNLEVSLGMSVTQVLERCGLTQQPTRVVCGGPMTGVSVIDWDRTVITHTTRAVLAVVENKKDAYYNCIGCGRCQQVCPQDLNPMYIYRFVKNSYYAPLRPFDAHLCIGCGTCSYVCPAKLDVSQAVLTAKAYALKNFVTLQEEEADEI